MDQQRSFQEIKKYRAEMTGFYAGNVLLAKIAVVPYRAHCSGFDEVCGRSETIDLEDGEALATQVLLRGRDPQIGNSFHGMTMEYGFWYFI